MQTLSTETIVALVTSFDCFYGYHKVESNARLAIR